MRAVCYLRVSTDEQADSALGLEGQLHACLQWAGRERRTLIGPFEDDVSGAAPLDRRPGLVDALAALRPGDALLVARRDRLGRDPMVIAMIEAAAGRKGCRVVSADGEGTGDDDPSSVLMRRIIDAFAEYERLIIKARTKAALAAKRRRGERTGQVPYGWKLRSDGKTLAPNPVDALTAAGARALRARGMTFRRIARHLTLAGRPTKNGGARWSYSAARRLALAPAPGAEPTDAPTDAETAELLRDAERALSRDAGRLAALLTGPDPDLESDLEPEPDQNPGDRP
jgi:DNA invertase Pin-like site-specific DNA recombinase